MINLILELVGSDLDHSGIDRCALSHATDRTIQQRNCDPDHEPLVFGLSSQAAPVAGAGC